MAFGVANQKFPMGGLGFDGQQAAGGMMGNEMVTYPSVGNTWSRCGFVWRFFSLSARRSALLKGLLALLSSDGASVRRV